MPRSSQLKKQWALFDAQEYQEAFTATVTALQGLQGADLRDAHRLLGLACYRQRSYREATQWLRQACERSEDADDWLRLALAATMQDNLELGDEAFAQVRFCHQVGRHSQQPGLYLQLYWYACALYEQNVYPRVRPLLDELAQAYGRLHNTDAAFLYARGLPFLSSVLELVTPYFREQHKHAEGVAWLEALAKGLDEAGQREVGRAIRELAKSDE